MYIFLKISRVLLLTGLFITPTYSLFAQQTDSLTQSQTDSLAAISKVKKGLRAQITVVNGMGKPLAGISVLAPGFASSITDDRGVAKISVPSLNALLVLSNGNSQNKEVYLKGKSILTAIYSETETNSLYGVINLPGGQGFKSSSPYSASSLNFSDSWATSSRETPDSYLQGKLAGLNVLRRSGTPSIGANMFLHGINSLNTTNQPLLVVDGMIYNSDAISTLFSGFTSNSLENLDIKDIADITLVKDAGASVYGTKGANGVMLITTKRANSEATKIDFATYGAYNFTAKQLPVMNATDYRTYLSGILQTSGLTDEQIQKQPYLNDEIRGNNEYFKYHFNTDWQKKVMNSGYNQNYHMNVSGGDNIARYNLSVGYADNSGILKNTAASRYFTRFNADFNFSRKFRASTYLAFSNNTHNLSNQGLAYKTSPIYLGLIKSPFMNSNDVGADGAISPNYAFADLFGTSNPSALIDNMDAINTNYRVTASTDLSFQLNKKVAIQSLLGITYDKIRDRLFIPARGVVQDTILTAIANNTLGSNTNRLFALFNDSRISYATTINKDHRIALKAGARFKQDNYEADYGITYNSSTDDYRSLSSGNAALRDFGGGLSTMRWLNTYALADYSLKNKYILSVSTAVDASSRFGRTISDVPSINGNKLAIMPAIAGAWLLSSEKFLANVKAVDLLKLRLSYGLSGNDDIGDYAAKSYYVSQNLYGLQGYARGNVGNTNLQWERSEKLNAGLDVSMLKERLNITLDVYQNTTSNILSLDRVNPVTGFDYSVSNSAAIQTKGLDFSANYRLFNKSKFTWDAGLTLSTYRSEVTKLQGDRMETQYGGATILTQVGRPVNVFYGYKTDGIYYTTEAANASDLVNKMPNESLIALKGGDVRFVNMNGDKVIDENDKVVIGNPTPDFTGMFSNNVNYRNWSVSALFTFSYGNDIYNGTRNVLEAANGYNNQLVSINNRWRAEGQVTNTPRASFGDPAQNSRFSDRWIEDGSYLRLRTVSLGYNFPIKNQYLKTLKVYANANNVFTITKYLGYDPEFSATKSVFSQGVDVGLEPQYRSVQLGVRLGL